MYELLKELFYIPRSITGDGFRKSLSVLNSYMGGVVRQKSVPSGTKCFDWIVPPEWNVKDAYIITPSGKKICEFKKNNLHLVGYSEPFYAKISLSELKNHLYTHANLPDAIPYVTSYYQKRWGFCLSKNDYDKLEDGIYEVFIDTEFNENGELNYGEIFIKGAQNQTDEILISTYLCHPQMANNELSGPVVLSQLVKWLKNQENLRYNYRLIIIPETIGSICYISKNYEALKANVKAGFVLSCIGDERAYSVVLSPDEDSLSDKVALHTIKFRQNPKIYSFLYRGSDERQFNTPNLNLGIVTLGRSSFNRYDEYHTSLDDLSVVTQNGLEGGLEFIQNCILNLEINKIYSTTTTCEPNLGSRGLINTINSGPYPKDMTMLRNFLAFCNGKRSVIQIADKLGVEAKNLKNIIENLLKFELIREMK
ncbi:putative Zn-peptidase, M28 family (DUF2172 domain) [Campylobacter iguaniorum]|uniref:DUF4910 domain-containing protein n=1 Tax=Campylobacter iguaniorum TaxID=1244531 RepID=UPI0007C9D5A1|nr:DUF4910 domain-containing protein [Campylobacter iguaniorum]ANE35431.1 putative Zn-peptidase, M28 family (DUF2172 domain) [Campylobacter iguaniorum]